MEKKVFKSGEVIIREGTWELAMYEIVSGRVGVFSKYGTNQEKKIRELGANEFFGEMGLIEARLRTATIVALENTEVNRIVTDDMETLYKEKPDRVFDILKQMSDRLRQLTADYVQVCNSVREYLSIEDAKSPRKKGILASIARILQEAAEYDAMLLNQGYDMYNDYNGMYSSSHYYL